MKSIFHSILFINVLAIASAGANESTTDVLTGLSVTPPAGYSSKWDRSGSQTSLKMTRRGAIDPSCAVFYQRAPFNTRELTYLRFNPIDVSDWQLQFSVTDTHIADIPGVRCFFDDRPAEVFYVHQLSVYLQTQRGHIHVICAEDIDGIYPDATLVRDIIRSLKFEN